MATELCTLLPSNTSICLQGSSHDVGLLEWWSSSPFKHQIVIVNCPPPCLYPKVGVAIIANSAYLHRSSIESALSAGYSVVSEKPLTFSRDESIQLVNRAAKLGLQLFSTNTYLFADYLSVFRRDWLAERTFSEVQVTWADAVSEMRFGEAKSYDSAVPIIFDVIPHVASIVLATAGGRVIHRSELTVRQGGCECVAKFVCDNLVINVNIARNAPRRIRLARFLGTAAEVLIDFTEEPGVASVDHSAAVCVDPDWNVKRKPLALMLHSVQLFFENGVMDERLTLKAALLANAMIDSVAESYVQQQLDFLGLPSSALQFESNAAYSYATKEVQSISQRVLPLLSQASPLRRLVKG